MKAFIRKALLSISCAASGALLAAEAEAEAVADAAGAIAAEVAEAAVEAAAILQPEAAMFATDNLWIMIAATLVFIMHLGFAALEAGLIRAKNCNNILFKNLATPAIGFIVYGLIGFAIMYPGDSWLVKNALGFGAPWLSLPEGGVSAGYNGAFTYWTDFFFQGMFAATCVTIVSGAVSERVKINAYLIFAALYPAFVYPLVGSWGWGGGWLDQLGFHDFAGSTLVHSVGGWAALAGVITIGPRLGKYVNGKVRPIMGHNMPLATIGVFLLWFGWFGFNGGSVLSADPGEVSRVLVTTMLGASAGIVAAIITSNLMLKRLDFSMVLNGCLAGLVGITASADCVTPACAVAIGAIAGIIVIPSVLFFDKIKCDDPVGALSVHLVCGIWGTLAVGIFSNGYSFMPQLIGVVAAAAASFPAAMLIFHVIKKTIGIRIDAREEMRGLDIDEHGMEAYSGFQIFTNQ